MNGIEALLFELVKVAESPLYSAYRWLGRQLGRDLSMSQFLRLVNDLVQQDALRLWSIDPVSQHRSRLNEIPEGLGQRYLAVDGLDDSFDPFALSLTLGPAAVVDALPDWEVDFDFDRERFRVQAKPGAQELALRKLAELFPDVELVQERMQSLATGRLEVCGSLKLANPPGGPRG